jgi:FecR protein
MNRQLKTDIDQLLEGNAEQIKNTRNKLGLDKAETVPDISRFENTIWNNYQERKSPGGLVAVLRELLSRRWVIAGFAFAAAAFAIGITLYPRTTPPVQYAKFDYNQNSVSSFSFNEKVKLHLRQAQGLEITGQGRNFRVSASKIWGHFEFEKKPGNSLAIKTAHGMFTVTGTSFLLYADDKEASLLVEEGNVRVEKNGKSITIRANEQYSSSHGELRSLPIPPEERKIFAAFRNPLLKNDAPELVTLKATPSASTPVPPPLVSITVTLFDGNTISGKIISESADSILIQPKNFKTITVRKAEIKESLRR